ncbi:MAG: formate/nitrite transporter family protein [Pseudomonadota bacterium]
MDNKAMTGGTVTARAQRRNQTTTAADAEDDLIEEASSLAPKLIYEVIRRDGEEELERPFRSLVWSGVAAGIMISFSVLAEAIFRTYLPDVGGRFLIENLGYSLGFVLVILGRMQLFTENTITTVLPFLVRPCWGVAASIARLWAIVLGANVVGAFAIAALYAHTPVLPDAYAPALVELSQHATGFGAQDGFFRAIPAGILIAALVWMMPQAKAQAFWVIIAFTWLIAAGDFAHIVAGSVEMAYLVVQGMLAPWDALTQFFVPVLAGNIVGGTIIFTLMAYGQVRDEIAADRDRH